MVRLPLAPLGDSEILDHEVGTITNEIPVGDKYWNVRSQHTALPNFRTSEARDNLRRIALTNVEAPFVIDELEQLPGERAHV
jgi:hypothetical protein